MFNPKLYLDNCYINGKGSDIVISYDPLWRTMDTRGITSYSLINKYGISSRTIYNLKHNKGITVYTLERLCEILDCTPNDVIEFKE